MKRVLISLAILALLGCVGPLKKEQGEPVQALASKYSTFQGIRAGAAELQDGNKELEVFLGTGEISDEEPFSEVLYCKAYNEEKKPLIKLLDLINDTPGDKVIFLYGKKVKDKYKEYYSGLDCVFVAVGVYHTKARRYIYMDAVYGQSFKDYWSWKVFMKSVIKQGTKYGEKAVPIP